MYIEIDGQQYPCEVKTGITQMGNTVIRVISEEAPVAEDGFVLISGNKTFDRSSFKYLYREDGNVKEYTEVAEEIIPASGYVSGVPENPLAKQLSAMNQRISDLTPYTESRDVYIGETECRFAKRNGNISAFLNVGGLQKPCEIQTDEAYIIVSFDELEDVGTVTISIQ